ncbi:MAG: 50S ribosomal protein L13 [Nanoarchaeota archaeon]|nr:50S ribosomal protein L13 [Nanoarchaeota archaeon]
MKTIIINAEDTVLGRLASYAAKQAREGNQIRIINAEKAIITGSKENIREKYKIRRERGDVYKGPFFPRTVIGLVKRSVRGMLPYKKDAGRKALSRVKVYKGFPGEIKGEPIILKEFTSQKLKNPKKMSVGELCKWLGSKK